MLHPTPPLGTRLFAVRPAFPGAAPGRSSFSSEFIGPGAGWYRIDYPTRQVIAIRAKCPPQGDAMRTVKVERRDASKPITVSLFGVYHDTLVRTRAGWRFKDRVLVPDGPEEPVSR